MSDINPAKYRFEYASLFGTKLQIFEYNKGTLSCMYKDGTMIKKLKDFIFISKKSIWNYIWIILKMNI